MNILLYARDAWPIDDALLHPEHHHIERIQGELTDLVHIVTTRHPDLVLLTSFEHTAGFLEELEVLCAALPHSTIGVYTPQAKPELLVDMMRAGVRDVFTDCQEPTIQQVLERAALRIQNAQPKKSRVLGFISGKGGDGSSSTAANLAYAIAHINQEKSTGIRVLLIDLSLPFGDLEMYLTHQNDIKDLADISSEADRLDFSLLNNMVRHLSSKLDLIVSPSSLDKVVRIESEQIQKLIHVAARHYNFVLLDLGSSMSQISLSVLDQLDELFLIGSPSLPSIRRSSQIMKSLNELELPDNKISFILNRCDQPSSITQREIENVIGKSARCLLPVDHEGMQDSLLRGKTIMELKPDSKFSRALNEIASSITGVLIRKNTLWQRLRKK